MSGINTVLLRGPVMDSIILVEEALFPDDIPDNMIHLGRSHLIALPGTLPRDRPPRLLVIFS